MLEPFVVSYDNASFVVGKLSGVQRVLLTHADDGASPVSFGYYLKEMLQQNLCEIVSYDKA